MDVASCRQTLVDASSVLNAAWPDGFVELIKAFEAKGVGEDLAGPSKNFPGLYRSLYAAKGGGDWKDRFCDQFESYVRHNRSQLLLTLSSRDRMYRRMGLSKEFLTVTAAAKEIGVRSSAIRRALVDLDLKPLVVRQGNGKACYRVGRQQLLLIGDQIRRCPDVYGGCEAGTRRNRQGVRRRFLVELGVTMDTAWRWFRGGVDFPSGNVLAKWPSGTVIGLSLIAQRLGVSVPTATSLRDAGLFDRSGAERRPMAAVVADDYAAFESKLKGCLPGEEGAPRNSVSLKVAVADRLRRLGLDWSRVLLLILEGQIKIVGSSRRARGLGRLLLSAADLAELTRDLQAKRVGEGLGQAEVAALLGVSDVNIVSRLTRARLLAPAHPARSATDKLLYRHEDVETFTAKFISLKEIGKRRLFGRLSTPGAVVGWLRKKGVRPTCGPDINDIPAIFFDRAKVEALSWFAEQE